MILAHESPTPGVQFVIQLVTQSKAEGQMLTGKQYY